MKIGVSLLQRKCKEIKYKVKSVLIGAKVLNIGTKVDL